MPSKPSLSAASVDRSYKIFVLLFFALSMELVFFKFIPDLGTATLPDQPPSLLADSQFFHAFYRTPGNIMNPRFAGTAIMEQLASFLGRHIHSSDVRLYPLRLAAAILTPIYAVLGLLPVLLRKTRYQWQVFAAFYCSYFLISLYVFYPYDAPSIALLSISIYLFYEERLAEALVVMLLTGIFRESSLHIVWLAFTWGACNRAVPVARRVGWVAGFSAAFVVEYFTIRHFYPGPKQEFPTLYNIFFGRGLWSLTTIVSLGVLLLVPVLYLRTRGMFRSDWRHNSVVLCCLSTPAWIIFYRVVGGNVSELRMLLPIVLPVFYGLAIPLQNEPQAGPAITIAVAH